MIWTRKAHSRGPMRQTYPRTDSFRCVKATGATSITSTMHVLIHVLLRILPFYFISYSPILSTLGTSVILQVIHIIP